MDSHRVSLLARRCGVRREQISGDLGQAWLASDSCPGSRSNEPVKLLWILSEPENGVGQKMLDKLTQTSDYTNYLRLCGDSLRKLARSTRSLHRIRRTSVENSLPSEVADFPIR